ncbi:progranulin isoform X1 [Ictalurus furcatus]|uniref:progranulin isoform X1 n=1 Tax=Ictalurus furcatus TaxID=66913 RepID=UPI0023507A51|nr:progranulin isoform X1 [Ictalurus furcatus]
MTAVLVLLVIGLVSSSSVCPDGTKCQDKNTCCQTKTGYACCKYPSAVCCPDKAHCCPQDYQCDLETQLCEKKGLPWYRIPLSPQIAAEEEEKSTPAPLVKSDNPSVSVVFCDNFNTCPDGTTCCRSPFGQWSCCVYIVGQCCRDGLHCCPFGYRCDSTSTYCSRGALRLPASPQIAAMQSNTIQSLSPQIPAENEEKSTPAPLVKSDNPSVSVVFCDNFNTCPDGTTCCRSPFGQWSCCVYIVGQCCRDGLHCCPFGYRCDSTSTYCFRGALRLPASPQIAAMQSNTIQDRCCQSETGCCPIGFHCDEESKACVRDFDHSSPLNVQNQAGIIHCSDRFYCPAGNSCCKTLTGQWACCPYTLGQCCKDGKHCCEYGYDCNCTFTRCKKGYSSAPALLTNEALLL